MQPRAFIFTGLTLGALACGGAAETVSPPSNANTDQPTSQTVSDPVGDTFGASASWDLTSLTMERGSGVVTAFLDFSQDVISPKSGSASAVVAFLDLDLDQNASTGGVSVADEFRSDGGSTHLGVDATVDLGDYAADSTVAVLDATRHVMGRVKPEFAGHRITIRIPTAVLGGDDGFLDAAATVGVTGRASDYAPNDGHLSLRPR